MRASAADDAMNSFKKLSRRSCVIFGFLRRFSESSDLSLMALSLSGKHANPPRSGCDRCARIDSQVLLSRSNVHEAGRPASERTTWEDFLAELTHVDVTKEIAIQAGIFRYDLARRGRTILIPDALVAATAIVTSATLVTANVKDFPFSTIRAIRLSPSPQ